MCIPVSCCSVSSLNVWLTLMPNQRYTSLLINHRCCLCVLPHKVSPVPLWQRAAAARGSGGVPAGDPEGNRQGPANLHPHQLWRCRQNPALVACDQQGQSRMTCSLLGSGQGSAEAGLLLNWPLCVSLAIRFCERCQLLKPDRCHHCSVCDQYVATSTRTQNTTQSVLF